MRSVAYGEGSVWAAVSSDDGSFGGRSVRIDPGRHQVQAEIPVDAIPTGEVGGGAMVFEGGHLWVTGSVEAPGAFDDPGGGADAGVIRIDTTTNEAVRAFKLSGSHGADLTFLDGQLWVLLFGDETVNQAMEVVRVDPRPTTWPRGSRLTRGGRIRSSAPGIASGFWKAVRERRTPSRSGDRSGHERGLAGRGPGWIHHVDARRFAGRRLDIAGPAVRPPRSCRRGLPEPPVVLQPGSSDCCGFLEADDRGIWFLSTDRDGGPPRLNLFEALTGEATPLTELDGGSPVAMAVAPDSVWTLNYEGTLTHVAFG